MSRTRSLLIVLVVLATVVAGCAPAAAPTKEAPTAAPAPTKAAPTAAPAPTKAAPTAVPAKKLTFAMVTDQSGLGDQAFNDATWSGFQALKKDYGVNIKVVESSEQAQYVPNLSTLAEQHADLIVGVGFLMKDAMNEVAPQYPNTHFGLVDACVDQPNVACIQFKENEGAFLMGAIAAYMSKTRKVGFVGGMETEVVKRFEAGYRAGVMTVDPKVKVLVSYAGAFNDPAKGKELALAQYHQGADVIFQVAGFTGTGVIDAAKETNKMVIGVDRDQNYLAPHNVISSMVKGLGKGVYNVGKLVIEGKFKGGPYRYGLAEGGVDIAPSTSKNVPPDILAKVKKIKQMIIDGKIKPPATLDELKTFTPPKLPS